MRTFDRKIFVNDLRWLNLKNVIYVTENRNIFLLLKLKKKLKDTIRPIQSLVEIDVQFNNKQIEQSLKNIAFLI